MVRRAPYQVSGSLTRPDLSCGATFLPEDLTFAPLVVSLPTGTERRYGAGGEDGNFVAASNRWSA
jgi:hypothetical protein